VTAPGHGGSWDDVGGGVGAEDVTETAGEDELTMILAGEMLDDGSALREEESGPALLELGVLEELITPDIVLVLKNELAAEMLDGGTILPHDVEMLIAEPLTDSITKQVSTTVVELV
jgi:hypothetical protein